MILKQKCLVLDWIDQINHSELIGVVHWEHYLPLTFKGTWNIKQSLRHSLIQMKTWMEIARPSKVNTTCLPSLEFSSIFHLAVVSFCFSIDLCFKLNLSKNNGIWYDNTILVQISITRRIQFIVRSVSRGLAEGAQCLISILKEGC